MIQAFIIRERRSDHGTEGRMVAPRFLCCSMELPWRNNKNNLSCIPHGTYLAKLVRTPRHGLCFMLQGVQGRFYILIHSGNVAGDVTKGLLTHSQGCILLGKFRGILKGQRAVLYSKPTISKMMKAIGEESFTLTIIDPIEEAA